MQRTEWDNIWEKKTLGQQIVSVGREVYNSIFRKFLKRYINQETDLVELGFGSASFGLSLTPLVKTYVGIDRSSQAVTRAKQEAARRKINNALFLEYDLAEIPDHLKNQFDVVWSQGLVEYCPSYHSAIQVHYELAKPGGIVFIGAPYKYSYLALWRWVTYVPGLKRFWPWTETSEFLSRKKFNPIRKIV